MGVQQNHPSKGLYHWRAMLIILASILFLALVYLAILPFKVEVAVFSILLIAAVLIFFIGKTISRNRSDKNAQAEGQTEEFSTIPLDKFEDCYIESLARKYEENQASVNR